MNHPPVPGDDGRDSAAPSIADTASAAGRSASQFQVPSLAAPFSPRFNLVAELELNSNFYQAPDNCEWLSIPTFPGYVLTALDTCRAQCVSVKTPSRSVTVSCAIHHGIKQFYRDSDIEDLIELKEDFHRRAGKAMDSESVEMAAEFFRHFPLGIPGTVSQARRFNVPLSPSIKKQVAERASELGLGIGPMGVLCIMVTISSQTVVHPKHAELASATVQSFLRGVRLRRRVAEVFLEEIV